MSCDDYEVESGVISRGNGTPDMLTRVKEHRAICVTHGGMMPSVSDLKQIFRDMFKLVGHAEICKDPECKCDDDPPSNFEREVIKQFKTPEKNVEKKA